MVLSNLPGRLGPERFFMSLSCDTPPSGRVTTQTAKIGALWKLTTPPSSSFG